jgi:multidrug resistance efflux pump
MKDFYLDKQQIFRTWWNRPYKPVAGVILLIACFAPVWRESVSGRFILEPAQRAVTRALVPGQITQVLAEEGTSVTAGSTLFIMRNRELEAETQNAQASLSAADARMRQAQLSYTDIGSARSELASRTGRYRSLSQQVAELRVASPISGVVVTPNLKDRAGSFVQDGEPLAEVDDNTTLQARIFLPEFRIQRVSAGAPVSLLLRSVFQPVRGRVNSIAPASSEMPHGLIPEEKYKGIAQPAYYVATVLLLNPGGKMRFGMSGDAKIEIRRQSAVGFVWETIREFLQRKIW